MAERGLILVVDDNQKNRALCRQNLEMEGFAVMEAANGLQGLEVALSRRPDLILLDIMMPEMDGYETLERLRRTPKLKDVSVLMLTAKAGAEDVVRALDMGANDYLRKPFDIDEMVARANTLVNLFQAQEAVREHKRHMESEMNQAAAIQARMPPSPQEVQALAEGAGLAIAALTSPSSQVNGDFYDLRSQDGALSLNICDCKGHGVWAGLMSMTVRALLRSLPPADAAPAIALARIEASLNEMLPEGEFVALAQWLYEPGPARLVVASAGMPPPLFIRPATGEVRTLDVRGRPPLGLNRFLGPASAQEVDLKLEQGDKLLAYSDGLSEAMDEHDELFGVPVDKICKLAAEQAALSAEDLVRLVWEKWRAFHGGRQDDDCTLVVLEKL